MGRLSAHITAGLPKPHGHEAIWAALRRFKGPFTLDRLYTETNRGQGRVRTAPGTVEHYVRSLTKAGIVEQVGREPGSIPARAPYLYRLAKDLGPDAPRVRRDGTLVPHGDSQTRIWRVIRVLGRFTWNEVALSARVNPHTVKRYLAHLNAAGYFRIVRPGAPNSPALYQLIEANYHGPAAPKVTRLKGVYDPNIGKVVWTGHAVSEEETGSG